MKVLFVTSEAHPLVKTGGLGDVAGALPAALIAEGLDVRVIMPGYPAAMERAEGRTDGPDLGDPLGFGRTRLIAARMPDGVPLWLVDCPALFDRPGGPYNDAGRADWPDNHRRFATLSWAAAYLGKVGDGRAWLPAVVHANDWQAGLAPVYLKQWRGPGPGSLITIHNILFQGRFPRTILEEVGLSPELFRIDGIEFHGQASFLKGGLQFADRVNTVSPTYAREIQTPEMGAGLDGLLRHRKAHLSGILNGADYEIWDPSRNPNLIRNYGVDGAVEGKAACKRDLQMRMDLDPKAEAPLFGVVSRMSDQKGLDLVLAVADRLIAAGGQLVVLGSGDPAEETAYMALAEARKGSVAVQVGYDEPLAHRIQAASDALLVPSRFEPCGLTQLYAMRFGTLPVVRRTGGLADTVIDVREPHGTGILFDTASVVGLWSALERTFALYADRDAWRAALRRAMQQDFGWTRAARAYRDLYRKTIETAT